MILLQLDVVVANSKQCMYVLCLGFMLACV